MQELQLLRDKLEMLMKKYSLLQVENARLKETVKVQLQTIDIQNARLATQEEQMQLMQFGQVITAPEERAMVRQQLDTVIGSIDNILNALND